MTRHWPCAGFRQLAGALGVGALLAALGACSRQPAAPVRAETGVTLVQAAGAVSREAAGKAPAPAAPGALAVADWLVTGNDGSAVVRLPDGRELQVGPGTRLRLVSASPGEHRGADGGGVNRGAPGASCRRGAHGRPGAHPVRCHPTAKRPGRDSR